MRVMSAAVLYFAIVFGVGFALGPICVFWLEPRIGPVMASFCEAPFLLVTMVVAARWIPKRLGLASNPLILRFMGAGALALQQVADLSVGIALRGMTLTDQIARLASAPGFIYLTLLMLFAVMPLLVNRQAG
jgi:hypothetical protein